ncbi:helix-turn-helix domain-containing protein, partial [Chloroflexus sp.]
LTLNEREQRVKKTGDPVERTRLLAVSHAKQGLTAQEIAKSTLPSTRWVQQVVRRSNQEGPAALKDRRHTNPGQRPKLTPAEQQRVLEALQSPLPMGA